MAKKVKLSSKLQKALATAGKKFKKVDAAASMGFTNEAVEDGGYLATLSGGELKELGGKAAVVLSYTITADAKGEEADCDGEIVSARYFLETDTNIAYLKRDLGRFVDDIDDIDLSEDLLSTLETIIESEPECKISVRTAGEFQNVYLNSVNTDGGGDDDDGDDDDDEDEDEPKGKKGKKGKGKKSSKDEDEDEDGDDEEAAEIAVDDVVEFKPPKAKKAKRCTVTKVRGGKATLEDEDGNEYKGILVENLEPVDTDEDDDGDDDEDDEDEPKGKKGKKGKAGGGKGGKGGKKSSKADDDDDDGDDEDGDDDDDEDGDDEDGDEVEIEVGSAVVVSHKGKEYKGKVKSLDEDDDKITVRFKVGKEFVIKSFKADKVEAA